MVTKIVQANSLKTGSFVLLEGVACKVVDVTISKSGKHGASKARIVAIGLLDDKKRDVVMPGAENIEIPIIEKKNAQVLYVSGDTANVMDSETYETFDLKIPEELKSEVVTSVEVLYWVILDQRVMKQVKK